ncbi:hypothetical protein HKI87_12g70970 [Chloropicon roscoffensis]|uniref:Uncharacterized protein n=1 Tax=Chloropicon roscoffensis TaxID=1461544 RepID=A0AAX4PHX1_9CHLO
MPVTKTSLGLCAAGSALVATCRYAWKKKIDTLYRFAYFFQYPVLGAGVLMSVQPENESMIEKLYRTGHIDKNKYEELRAKHESTTPSDS